MSPAALCRLSPLAKKVLLHLETHGSISHAEAVTVYRMPKVARQIFQLREEGIRISTELRQDATGLRYARYTLVSSYTH
jgi:hypothetical protein